MYGKAVSARLKKVVRNGLILKDSSLFKDVQKGNGNEAKDKTRGENIVLQDYEVVLEEVLDGDYKDVLD